MICCSTSTKPETGTLSGKVILVNDTGDPDLDPIDYSGITVALYNLAFLDTTIIRINNQYSQIGVQINQETKFDHRYQETVIKNLTNAVGSFKLEDIMKNINEINIISNRNIVFYGSSSHLFNYLNGDKLLYSQPFLMNFTDQKETQRVREVLNKTKELPYFVLVYGRSDIQEMLSDNLITNLLISYGYKEYKKGFNYQIFVPFDLILYK